MKELAIRPEEASTMGWPETVEALVETQRRLAGSSPGPWAPPLAPLIAGTFVCSPCGRASAEAGEDRLWAAAALVREGTVVATSVVSLAAPHGYVTGLLALREGPAIEAAVLALPERPDVVLVRWRARGTRCALRA